ncbi:MAG TPA: LysM peptidoglycan-binding domain-containing protein [Steroidobacteraceae bacterium]|nr:LysM peptidoglycan-binding domain-containing protein [Steroidobacteraceae bacterium]
MKARLFGLVCGSLLSLSAAPCDLKRLEIDRPNLLILSDAGLLDVGIDRETLESFPISRIAFDHIRSSKDVSVPVEGGGTQVEPVRFARIVTQTDVDGSGILRKYESIVREEIGANSCEERYFPWGFTVRPAAGGKAEGTFSVRYEKWSCGGFHYPKCNGFKCRRAYKHVRNKWFQKTLDFRTEFTARVKSRGVDIFYENKRTTGLNDVEKFLGRLLAGRKTFDRSLDAMDSQGWAAQIGNKTSLEHGGIPEEAMPRYAESGTGFLSDKDRGLFLRLHAESPMAIEEAEYCFAGWPEIQSTAAMIRSASPAAKTEHHVLPDDSLWKIAKMNYGDGRYISALLSSNPPIRGRANLLRAGETVSLPLMYKLASAQGSVRDGESVARISSRVFGSETRTRDILTKNASLTTNPDLIYPTQVLELPD